MTMPKYQIGQRVWRKACSPLRYPTAIVVCIMLCKRGWEYAISFNADDLMDRRWYPEEELCP